jgi:hypothetical protein
MKSRGISNQPTYNQDRTDLAATVHMLHKFTTQVEYIGVQNKSYYNTVQNNITEGSSFKPHTLSSNTVLEDSHGPQKALDKTNRVTIAYGPSCRPSPDTDS